MRKYIVEHPGVAITLTYLYLSFVGLTYQYFHLKSFDVSLFDFSNTNDYLLAFLKSAPFLFMLVILHFLLLVKDILFNQRHASGGSFKERCKKLLWKSRKLEFLLILVAMPFFAGWIGNVRSDDIKGHGQIVIGEATAKKLGVRQTLYLFDTTQSYLFLVSESKRLVVKRDELDIFEIKSSNKSIQSNASAD